MNLVKFLKTPILQETCKWLALDFAQFYMSHSIIHFINLNSKKGNYCVCVKRITLCNCLCSSSPSSPSRSSALSGISENLEQKTISQTTKQIIQFRVLEIQFRPLKYMTGIRIRKNLSNIPFLSKR